MDMIVPRELLLPHHALLTPLKPSISSPSNCLRFMTPSSMRCGFDGTPGRDPTLIPVFFKTLTDIANS